MSEGWSVASAGAILRAQFRAQSYVEAELWAQLHVGPPGADGMDNVAVNDVRVDALPAFGTDPVGNTIANDDVIGPWPAAPTGETYTHVSFHSDEFAGTFISSGVVTSAAVTTGDEYAAPAGDCTATIPVAS